MRENSERGFTKRRELGLGAANVRQMLKPEIYEGFGSTVAGMGFVFYWFLSACVKFAKLKVANEWGKSV